MCKIKRLKGKIPLLLLITIFTSAFYLQPVSASDLPYVNDFVGVVSEETKLLIEEKNKELEEISGAQIYVTIISSLEGQDLNVYADTLYEYLNPGDKNKNNGLSVLLVIEDGVADIQAGSGVYWYLSNNNLEHVKDKYLMPEFNNQNYDNGISQIINGLFNHMRQYESMSEEEKTALLSEGNVEVNELTSEEANTIKFLNDCLIPTLLKLIVILAAIYVGYTILEKIIYFFSTKQEKDENLLNSTDELNEYVNNNCDTRPSDISNKQQFNDNFDKIIFDSQIDMSDLFKNENIEFLSKHVDVSSLFQHVEEYSVDKDEKGIGHQEIMKLYEYIKNEKDSPLETKPVTKNKIDTIEGLTWKINEVNSNSKVEQKQRNTVIKGDIFKQSQNRKEKKEYLANIKRSILRTQSIVLKDTVNTFRLTIDNAFDEQLTITINNNFVQLCGEKKDGYNRILDFKVINPIGFAKLKRFKILITDESQRSAEGYITVTKEYLKVKDHLNIKKGEIQYLEIQHSPLDDIEIDTSLTDESIAKIDEKTRKIKAIDGGYTTLIIRNLTDNTERLISISVDNNEYGTSSILDEVAGGKILDDE